MIIIVEGVDGVGKSTLCEKISRHIGAPIYKPVGTPLVDMTTRESQAEDRGAWGVTLALPDSVDIIFDRAFPSEYAYGVAFDRVWDNDMVAELDKAVAQRSHLAIHVAAPSMKPAWVDDIPEARWQRIADAYHEYRHMTHMDWLVVPPYPDTALLFEQLRARSLATI